jgi:membrane protein
MTSLIDALTVAYHETETRGFLRRTSACRLVVLGGALLLGGVLAVAGVASRGLSAAPAMVQTVAPVLIWSHWRL